MARLPQPGGDSENWGEILNDYLSQSLDSTGKIKDNLVTEPKLSLAVQTKLNQPANITDGSISKTKLIPSVQDSLAKADSALQAAPVSSINTRTGAITLTKNDVDLTNVDNTADLVKPVSTIQQATITKEATRPAPPKLRRAIQAIAAQRTNQARILIRGSSTVESYNAPTYLDRWTDGVQDVLRLDRGGYFITGGINAGYTKPVMYTGGATFADTANGEDLGWAGKAVCLRDADDTITHTPAIIGKLITSFKIYYRQTSGGGILRIVVDGGTPTDVPTNGSEKKWISWTSPALTRGSHTVTLTRLSGGTVTIEGIDFYDNDETTGVRVYEAGHSGWTSTQMLANQLSCVDGITAIQPDLFIYQLGTNDLNADRDVEGFIADARALVNADVACCTNIPSVLFIMPAPVGGNPPTSNKIALRNSYVTALQTFADENDWQLTDLEPYLPSPGRTGNLYSGDTLHLTGPGYAALRNVVASLLEFPKDLSTYAKISDLVSSSGASAQVNQYITAQTNTSYTVPTGAKMLAFRIQASGGGGGGGRRGANTSLRTGGGGGASGGYTEASFRVADLASATLYVTVGVAGAGGALAATDNSDGGSGVAGGSSFVLSGSTTGSAATIVARAAGGTGGSGGNSTGAASGGSAAAVARIPGAAGAASSATGTIGIVGGGGPAGGGGSGGGITTTDTVSAGGAGGYPNIGFPTGVSGAAAGASGGSGSTLIGPTLAGGYAGAGGGSSITSAGGNGGAGHRGAGGGGGGAALNGSSSGAGGIGGVGFVEIVAYF